MLEAIEIKIHILSVFKGIKTFKEEKNMKYPPFCPNPVCKMHSLKHRQIQWYELSGYYSTAAFGEVRRYRCRACRMRFSDQTFSLNYAAKKRLPYDYIFKQLKSAAGVRDIARDLRVSPTTIQNRISRLSRQAVAVHNKIKSTIKLNEDLVSDGFESFTVSQYFPNNIHLLAGKDSQYLYTFDYAYLARKGRMTEAQKKKNRQMRDKAKEGATITDSFLNICKQIDSLLKQRTKSSTVLFTDEKPQYRNVLSKYLFSKDLVHVTVNSKAPRTLTNDLFSVNYLDREIRKDNANHVRETVQFSRNVNNSMERLAIYGLYHNYVKPYRINSSEDRVHAEVAGINRMLINSELKNLFTMRRFFSRMGKCSDTDKKIWFKEFRTPGKSGLDYVPGYLRC
jgi:transposase-like protein